MNDLFGIPASTLATVFAVALGAGLAVVAVLALRDPVLLKLGLRNIPRRRGRSVLIVTGLMLGTAIIAAALATGDTMSSTIRSSVVRSLGPTDELVSVRGADVESIAVSESTQVSWFAESAYRQIRAAVSGAPRVDGVAPPVIETVAVQDHTSLQNEPRVALFASDPAALAAFAPIRSGSETMTLSELAAGEIYVNRDAADELSGAAGDRLLVLAGNRARAFRVKAVVEFDGAGTDGAAVLLPLATAQELLVRPGLIEHVLVSNRGDAEAGAKLNDEVERLLAPTLGALGLESDPEKKDGLEIADAEGNAFMTMFTTFGSFSIAAGILLIFLIFVMLAAERRGELGIARAVGTRRSHLVRMYLFEGVAYDVVAAAVGTLLGLAVAYGMVIAMAAALGSFGIEITYSVRPQSILLAYAIGVLLTLAVVTVSAWRVSVLNIATAVRNLPEPPRQRRRRRWILPLVGLLAGGLLTASGISSAQGTPFMLGVSLALVSLASLARMLGAHDGRVYTAAGIAIVVLWLLPWSVLDRITQFSWGMDAFLMGGLMIVVGATWVGADVQRAPPGRLAHVGLRSGPSRRAGSEALDGLSAPEPLPDRRHAGDVHARRLHARRRHGRLGLVHERLGRRRRLRRRFRRASGGRAGDAARERRRRCPARGARRARRRDAGDRPARGVAGENGSPLRVVPRHRARRRVPGPDDLRLCSDRGRLRIRRRRLAGAADPAEPRRRRRLRRAAAGQLRPGGASLTSSSPASTSRTVASRPSPWTSAIRRPAGR
jgi:putative ABC transport system permease protein